MAGENLERADVYYNFVPVSIRNFLNPVRTTIQRDFYFGIAKVKEFS
jgi:hypothetical protein